MKGSVTVGKDPVAKSFTKASIKGSSARVKATVTLKEDAKVTLSVKGLKKKSVTKSLKKGKRSVSVGKLKAGSYKATVVAAGRVQGEDHEEGNRRRRLRAGGSVGL